MLRTVLRVSSRRCLHTSPTSRAQSRSRYGFAIGASAVAASYFTWHLASQHRRIALEDSPFVLDPVEPKSDTTSTPSSKPKPKPTSKPTKDTTTPTPETNSPTSEDVPTSNEEAANKGAYDPVTGEINWDCPCLGGMAHGPCGQEFRDAFSCFVYSEDEPKGINCVDKFKAMQDCFRAHPDVYADEIMDDDDEEELPTPPEEGAGKADDKTTPEAKEPSDTKTPEAMAVPIPTQETIPSTSTTTA